MTGIPNAIGSCFWEITRACDLCCGHCRASSTKAPGDELTRNEALDVASQLIALGVRLVILTGGEPTLSPHWLPVAERLSQGGLAVRLFTNGFGLDEKMLGSAQEAGIRQFAVSLDGPAPVHDRLRPARDIMAPSAFERAADAIRLMIARSADVRVVTQVNRINVTELRPLYKIVRELGVKRWQVHLFQPIGRGATNREELLCHPTDLERVVEILLLAAKEKQVLAPLHCTVGYMTAEEPVLRARELKGSPVWRGCQAGIHTIAITPDGSVKGCTTLPDEFITGTLRQRSLKDIWLDDECFPYTRKWSPTVLSSGCARCALAATCRAGCPAMAYGVTGSIGANPFCLRLSRRAYSA